MAEANPKQNFSKQISETRKSIKGRFKKSHEALAARENILLARVNSIEREYNQKIQLQNELAQSLRNTKSSTNENLKANKLTDARKKIITMLDEQLTELTADTLFRTPESLIMSRSCKLKLVRSIGNVIEVHYMCTDYRVFHKSWPNQH